MQLLLCQACLATFMAIDIRGVLANRRHSKIKSPPLRSRIAHAAGETANAAQAEIRFEPIDQGFGGG